MNLTTALKERACLLGGPLPPAISPLPYGAWMRDAASDDLALSDVEPENVAKISCWFGNEDEELPAGLSAKTDWDMCSAFSRSTGASFYKVGDKDLRLPPVPDEVMPAAIATPAAASSDAPMP